MADILIIDVWADNVHKEFTRIRDVFQRYPYIAFDTEFPGFVHPSNSRAGAEIYYGHNKANVDSLKLIQVGLTFDDEFGSLPTNQYGQQIALQINLCDFDPSWDRYSMEAMNILRISGIDFEKNHTKGVTSQTLADSLASARLVSNPPVHWVTFHGTYDTAYLVKLLNSCTLLPDALSTFLSMVNRIFPNFYDAKHMVHHHYV
ncbi:hypothetical protein AMTRI_Chr11g97780 [Amborella trichopoda]|uniref:poly(A)-specific ribonuclease n=1 Tax=Amborella trichopoda TaxID=13333 RepID=U5DEM1_AMBTC|nr:probable CCR4-associated factor 1 homolog 6 [Amborella trichopoda]ERN20660.1 hypothetical protein AMTR_s00070p00175430 [Amborella trichopoda]|eukprot:XP_006859193.1 probable CCR4-associated factor 1 homolog 6 [Amborella trichopoda]